MAGIEDLLRRRGELLQEIDREILRSHGREATLLFTDIAGSTAFYERHGDIAGRQMVQAHNDLLFPLIEGHGGRVLKTIGDSIMAVFVEPARAVACTAAMQRAIAAHNAGAGDTMRFRVRMGLHHGTVVGDERDVFGDAVNTAARVEALADAGEVLATAEVESRAAGCGVPLVHLARAAVKGRAEPVDLYGVDWEGRGAAALAAAWQARQAGPRPAAGTPFPAPFPAVPPAVPRAAFPAALDVRAELAALSDLPARGNPYLNRVMLPHPAMFFGRRAAVRRIMGRLGGVRPQSLSIVGERRAGKSSLLNFIRSPVARGEWLEAPERCLFALVDFQQARALSAERVLSLTVTELGRQAGVSAAAAPVETALRAIGEEAAAQGFRIVLLLDEFETVTANPSIGPDFYAGLRSLANTLPVAFVCATARGLKELCATRAISDSPFFNIFSVVHIGALEPAEAEALVTGPSAARGIPLGPVCSSALAMGGRLPFFLQVACSAWFEFLESEGRRAEEYAGAPAPGAVLETFREEAGPHFEYILESLPPAEVEALRGAAAAGGLPPGEETGPAASLERRGYLVREGAVLVPFSGEFARFVGRR